VIKRMTMFVATAFFALAMAVPAFAVSPSQEQCEAQGGTFDRQQGQVSCVIVTEEEGKNPKFTEETTTTTTGQGNAGNKPTEDTTTDCEGTGSDKCPPGQFK
jgi:hypothetical protein